MCNDAAADMQSEITAISNANKNADEVDESLVIGAKPECFAFCYGLIIIGMSRYNEEFLQSYGYIQFHTRVLNRLVNSAAQKYNSMNVDIELVETQLKKTKTKDLQKMMQATKFYLEHATPEETDPFAQILKHIGAQISLQNAAQYRQLRTIVERILEKIDASILHYRK